MLRVPTYQHGAQRLPDGRVRFRLWAPAVAGVTLHIEDEALPMEKQDHGWYELQRDCPAGTSYCFEPQGVGRVPDPASRMQESDVDGPSVVVDHDAYRWVHDRWRGRPWHEVVLYEAHAGLLGGFSGMRERLADLADLGITALQLMPVADFPGPRNWGYDGVLPYAPDRAYGTPDELKALIDAAHGLGMMVFLDVVYNHFGPVGNYLPQYAPDFFRNDVPTPWGPAIDFRRAQVSSFFAQNALYWLKEYRFDGLRFDAVHAIVDNEEWLSGLAVQLREALSAQRAVHLVLENEDNTASLLQQGFDAQWNDDIHHVVHHLLTGETRGYYTAYERRPTEKLARALAQGFIYQGEPSPAHEGRPRGEPSSMLPPTSFVFFLQNHDQVGNRAQGERLTTLCTQPQALWAAIALQLLSPSVPLLFMGEEYGARTPFLYFTSFSDPELAAAVRAGRRAEFAGFHDEEDVPDPNAEETWQRSRLQQDAEDDADVWRQRYRQLLALRHEHIVPWLPGAACEAAEVLAKGCVAVCWVLGNGCRLTIYCNLSDRKIDVAPGLQDPEATVFYESTQGAAAALLAGILPEYCTIAGLSPARLPDEEDDE